MPRHRVALLAATSAVVVAFTVLVLIDRPADRPTTVAGSPTVPAAAGPTSTAGPSASSFDGAALPANVRARDFALTDQTGRRVSLGTYRGQVVVLAFLSSTCMNVSDRSSCVLVAQQIRGALDELPKRPVVLFVSVDPRADAPARVTRFLAQVSLTGRVLYASGSESRLRPVWREYGVVGAPGERPKRATPDGPISVLLIDGRGLERVTFGVEQLTPEGLAHDIAHLQSER
jgi:protein SCO1/2